MTFGDKLFGDSPGYPTPDDIPAEYTCLTLYIPADASWWAVYIGLLHSLSEESAWQQLDGGISAEDAAEEAFNIFDDALARAASGEDCLLDCTDILACLYPPGRLARMAATGRYQTSDDGGSTWDDASAEDTRFNGPRTELTAGFDCDDAHAVLGYIQSLVDALKAQMDIANTGVALSAVLIGAMALIFSFGVAAPVVAALVAVLIATDSSLVTAALTNAVWERLLCNLSEELGGLETITATAFDAVLARIVTEESGLAETVLWNVVNQLGPVGLQNAISVGSDPVGVGDGCCGWCQYWDFESAQGSWALATAQYTGGNQVGNYSAGWNPDIDAPNSIKVVGARLQFTDAAVGIVKFQFDMTSDASGTNRVDIKSYKDGVVQEQYGTVLATSTVFTDEVFQVTLDSREIDEILIGLWCGSFVPYGSGTIKAAWINGIGASPFGADNCP